MSRQPFSLPQAVSPFPLLLMAGSNMGIFMYRKFDAQEATELSMRESYGHVVNILYPAIGTSADIDQTTINAASTAMSTAVAASRGLEERRDIANGLIFGFIAVPARKSDQLFYSLLTSCMSDWNEYVNVALESITNVGFYRTEPESRGKLMNLVMEMVRCASPYGEAACIHLMRCIPGCKPYASCDMGNLVLNALSMNKKWLLELPDLVAMSFYTFLRLIPEHNKPEFKPTFDREIGYCLYLWKERPSFCLKIGRDVIRALQDVGHIKAFHAILLEIAKGPSFKEVVGTPTTQMILKARITPEMEKDINFVLDNVTYAQQKYYQGWLFSKYFTGDCEYIIPDLVRYLCCVCDPPEENKTRDILDRWAFVGWLYSQMRTDGGKALVKQAVFYDWYWFNPKVDKVAFLEPAAGVMFYSLAQYREMTATFLEFLVISSEIYCVKEKQFVMGNIKKSFAELVAARKFQSLQQLFDFDGVHKSVHDKFALFNPIDDAANDMAAVPQQNEKKQHTTMATPKEQPQPLPQKVQAQTTGEGRIPLPQVSTQQQEAPQKKEEPRNLALEKDKSPHTIECATELFLKEPTFGNFACVVRLCSDKTEAQEGVLLKAIDLFSNMIEEEITECSLRAVFLHNSGPLSMLFDATINERNAQKRQNYYVVLAELRKRHPSVGFRFFTYATCRSSNGFGSGPRSFLNRKFMGSIQAFARFLAKSADTKIGFYLEFASKVKEQTNDTLDNTISEDFVVCAKQGPHTFALLVPILLKHVELDTKSALNLVVASVQFLLPDQLEWLRSCVADGSLSITPRTDNVEEVYNAVIERKDLEASEKRDALRLIFTEYDHRGVLADFIRDTLPKDIKIMEPDLFSCFPITASTIQSILLCFPAQDAERALDSLFTKNKDEFTKIMCSVIEGSTEKTQIIEAISKMDPASQWVSHNERLKEAIEEEHKKRSGSFSTMKRSLPSLEQLPPKTLKVE